MSDPARDLSGPTLHEYVETRFAMILERMRERLDDVDRRFLDSDLRYQQRYDASLFAIRAAFAAQEKAISAALASADRAVTKAELATEKRFESVNEFRGTLDSQQRTLITRSEVAATFHAMNEKVARLQQQADNLTAERAGIKGGWGYAVGVVGFVLLIASFLLREVPTVPPASPQVIYVPAAPGTLVPTPTTPTVPR